VTVAGTVIAAGVLTFILVAVLTEAMRRVAIEHRLVDQPRADRKGYIGISSVSCHQGPGVGRLGEGSEIG
jgi:hypothetical protein